MSESRSLCLVRVLQFGFVDKVSEQGHLFVGHDCAHPMFIEIQSPFRLVRLYKNQIRTKFPDRLTTQEYNQTSKERPMEGQTLYKLDKRHNNLMTQQRTTVFLAEYVS